MQSKPPQRDTPFGVVQPLHIAHVQRMCVWRIWRPRSTTYSSASHALGRQFKLIPTPRRKHQAPRKQCALANSASHAVPKNQRPKPAPPKREARDDRLPIRRPPPPSKAAAMRTHFATLALALLHAALTACMRFEDVTAASGLRDALGRRLKYGGASLADLDGDGHVDLLLGHHNDRWAAIYFNRGDGTFKKADWAVWRDTHALTPFHMSASRSAMHFALTQGGGNGMRPRAPIIYKVFRNRSVVEVPQPALQKFANGRGRSAIFLNLHMRNSSRTSVVLTNARLNASQPGDLRTFQIGARSQFIFKNITTGFATETNTYATVTDIDGDGVMEIVCYHDLRVYRRTKPFILHDISKQVLPNGLLRTGTVAVAELDYDNDGRFDLYVARTNTGDLRWLQRRERLSPHQRDYLLRNVGGRYVDVSESAGIPAGSQTRGVSVADFNNDGFVDILLVLYQGADLLLVNNGDGTFRKMDARLARADNVRGDMATAVDLDRDGMVDVVVSEGDWIDKRFGGFYRLLRNVRAAGGFLHVRVKASPSGRATSLHAVVRVVAGDRQMWRRVGSPGTAVSMSYVEVLHFGLGGVRAVDVFVTWSNGERDQRRGVPARELVVFGG